MSSWKCERWSAQPCVLCKRLMSSCRVCPEGAYRERLVNIKYFSCPNGCVSSQSAQIWVDAVVLCCVALRCVALRWVGLCGAVRCGVVLCGVVLCGVVLCGVVLCCVVLWSCVLCCAVLFCVVLANATWSQLVGQHYMVCRGTQSH